MAFPKGAAALLAEKDLHGSLITNESNPVVYAGITNILRPDPERTLMLIYNLSASEIFLGFTEAVRNVNGMLLPPNGGFMMMNVTEDYEAVTLAIHAYTSGNNLQMYTATSRRETGLQE